MPGVGKEVPARDDRPVRGRARPVRFPDRYAIQHRPPRGQRLDEQQPAPALVEGSRGHGGRAPLAPGVGDVDPEPHLGRVRECHLEVPPGHPTVGDGVGGELGDEQPDGVGGLGAVREVPAVQLMESVPPGEAGTARGRAEALGEHTYGDGGFAGHGGGHGANAAAPGGSYQLRNSYAAQRTGSLSGPYR